MRHIAIVLLVLIATGALAASGRAPRHDRALDSATTREPVPAPARRADSLLWIEIRNVTMHLDERATIRVRQLRGQVRSTSAGHPAILDDRSSFSIQVTSGSVGLTGDDLTTLLNDFVFAYHDAPLEKLRARPEGGQVTLEGTMHKGVALRFTINSAMSLTPEGMIRLHPTRTRILGVNGLKLMNALGLKLDDLLDLTGSRGASVRGNDIYLDPEKILPPPAIAGRLASARVEGSEVAIEFVTTPEDSVFGTYVRPDSAVANFVYFRGAQLQFGKLLMSDTDLLIVDADPSDPFDLNLQEYAQQLVAGTSRTLANLGLRVEMPDYGSLGPGRVAERAGNVPRVRR
ncbi:MAG TPA: hypothetical protein VK922_16145 [Gemmatimonadaceae bacterium]|nr:hypothetical protein [Gemmatimonadaceae bacterium]